MIIFRESRESAAALSNVACNLRGIFIEKVTRSVVFGRPTGRLDFDMFSPDRERGNIGVTDNRALFPVLEAHNRVVLSREGFGIPRRHFLIFPSAHLHQIGQRRPLLDQILGTSNPCAVS